MTTSDRLYVAGLDCGAPLLEGDLPEAAVVILEVMAEDGEKHLRLASSDPLTSWAQLGMLRAAVLAQEDELLSRWQDME